MGDQPTTMCMSESIDGEVQLGEIMFCDLHEDEVRMALIQRGFSQDLELTLDEREAKMLSGEMDAFVSVPASTSDVTDVGSWSCLVR